MAAIAYSTEMITATSGETEVAASNISQPRIVDYAEGSKVILNETAMEVGRPYPFILEGVWVVAVKQHDGAIDFYQAAPQ